MNCIISTSWCTCKNGCVGGGVIKEFFIIMQPSTPAAVAIFISSMWSPINSLISPLYLRINSLNGSGKGFCCDTSSEQIEPLIKCCKLWYCISRFNRQRSAEVTMPISYFLDNIDRTSFTSRNRSAIGMKSMFLRHSFFIAFMLFLLIGIFLKRRFQSGDCKDVDSQIFFIVVAVVSIQIESTAIFKALKFLVVESIRVPSQSKHIHWESFIGWDIWNK